MIRLVLAFALLGSPAAAQSSNAARYLAAQEVSEACDGRGGTVSDGLFERDLDGDGRDDLLIAHEGIRCAGGGFARSAYCGMQVCTVKIWLRRGDLLKLEEEFLGGGITLGPTSVPVISGYAHGGASWSMRWSGGGFR
ncbi:hypothetical protein JANAI62_17340 [Jannaschia pagri]|uniref:FG-GAP repeat-containing protein n=1 Tax=Jannaschia pagri TaxID=2829797 RepID=A0ABQ4NL34_9RHOB|nr:MULTISPECIES: hypothetical protein [unclassified Jannaschia]GIT91278.1 hypothetical protein JANAI61_17360 [Jannaschia sp. AI_61]GIT95111.1 hypothetical protein JANAI62_17340 [Jannaschia sp. AI_62]